ncbi:MAG: TonB-dependent receptor [Ignavibacteriales bacterium]|nr:TonB-dependent receptor [Ignavibacteriales bacterium]
MRKISCIAALCLFGFSFGAAQPGSITGSVFEGGTKRPLESANILLQGTSLGTTSDSAGQFRIDHLQPGGYRVQVSFVGYRTRRLDVIVGAGETVSLELGLEPTVLPGQTIVISATRARERENPVAFATLTAADLKERYSTQDIPQLLSELPSTTFYSENGNGIGYNYLNIRGFDQRRISVMINGIPQNDPEDHNVYWLDFPDLAANLEDMQVQRGAGSAFHGPPAIGGSVNLITSTFARTPGIELSLGSGSFTTRKYSVAVQSGLVQNKYQVYGRLSRITTEGYRERSWADFSSYFLGAVRYDESMTTQFNFYGGPVADHLAYYGISKSEAYSSDPGIRRRNPIARPEEIENFSQPHYELLHEWRVDERITLNNAIFLVTGEGFFDYDGSWAPYSYYRITRENGFNVVGDPEDQYIPNALIRAYVRNTQYGWLPRATIEHNGGALTVGAEFRSHRSVHWGALRWGEQLPPGVTPDYHYYEYEGAKDIVSVYAHEMVPLSPGLIAQLDLQYVFNRYHLRSEKYLGTEFSVPYHFLNPRFGLNYNITEKLNFYTQVSRTSREPRLKNLYDAAEASTPASWGAVTPQFETTPGGQHDFSRPLVKPEKLTSMEIGAGYTAGSLRVGANVYYMDFTDEIIKSGQLDRFGQPVTGNAEKTLHQGIELTAATHLLDGLELSGTMTVSRNRLTKYTVYDGGTPVALNGNAIAGFPDFLANGRATYRAGAWISTLSFQHVGAFSTDNFQNPGTGATDPGRTVDAYTVLHAWLSYQIPVSFAQELELRLQINNLLNKIYAGHGEGDDFFPAAERNIFASIRLKM